MQTTKHSQTNKKNKLSVLSSGGFITCKTYSTTLCFKVLTQLESNWLFLWKHKTKVWFTTIILHEIHTCYGLPFWVRESHQYFEYTVCCLFITFKMRCHTIMVHFNVWPAPNKLCFWVMGKPKLWQKVLYITLTQYAKARLTTLSHSKHTLGRG